MPIANENLKSLIQKLESLLEKQDTFSKEIEELRLEINALAQEPADNAPTSPVKENEVSKEEIPTDPPIKDVDEIRNDPLKKLSKENIHLQKLEIEERVKKLKEKTDTTKNPYTIRYKNGSPVDKNGDVIINTTGQSQNKSPDLHVPLKEFSF